MRNLTSCVVAVASKMCSNALHEVNVDCNTEEESRFLANASFLPWYNSFLSEHIFQSLHGEGLACSRLPVREHCPVITLDNALQEAFFKNSIIASDEVIKQAAVFGNGKLQENMLQLSGSSVTFHWKICFSSFYYLFDSQISKIVIANWKQSSSVFLSNLKRVRKHCLFFLSGSTWCSPRQEERRSRCRFAPPCCRWNKRHRKWIPVNSCFIHWFF